tara:strand:+ start:44 stop:262 length:219 start_codon:yes stop_codon:yes gene_type:complete
MDGQETLFDMSPDENLERIEDTEVEWVTLYFSDEKKKKLIFFLEKLLTKYPFENHSDLIFKIVEERIEENNC